MTGARYFRLFLASAAIALVFCLVAPAWAFDTPPVETVVGGRMPVNGATGEGSLPVAVSQDWSRPLPEVTSAVIVVHGAHRNAAGLFRIGTQLAPGKATLIIAPQFLLERDIAAHALPADVLRWGRDNWTTGGDATGPVAISSYDAIDAILATLADRSRLPNLKTVVLAGFSGGGWLTQRYAALGRAGDTLASWGIALRYVVGSPASYLYFSDERPLPGGGFGAFAGAATCPNYNRWPYGFAGDIPRYAAAATRGGAAAVERRYAGLDLVYLVGTADNDPHHWELDMSCAGEAQGPDRYARSLNFFRYMQARDAAILRQKFSSAPGARHDPAPVFGSPCGRAALFGETGCSGG
jgi:hypothetical protein